MSFGENLRTLIEERDMKQKDVAASLNIAPSTLGSYLQGVREPDFTILKSIANFFQVSIDYLLDNRPVKAASPLENELLRIFRSLSPEQQRICVEQCRVFLKSNQQKEERREKSS